MSLAERVAVKLGVTRDDGEVFFRRVDLSRHGRFGNGGGKVLFQTLKLYAIQSFLGAEDLPEDAALNQYKVTLFYTDLEGDKILVGSVPELKDALRLFEKHQVAKIMAKVETLAVPNQNPIPTQTPPVSSRASTESATQTQTFPQDASSTPPQGHGAPPPPPPPPMNHNHHPPIQNMIADAVVSILGPAVSSIRIAAAEASAHAEQARASASFATPPAAPTPTPNVDVEIEIPPIPEMPEPEVTVATSTAAASASAPPEPSAPVPPSPASTIAMDNSSDSPSAMEPRPFIHGRHTCDGCLSTPIVGLRYHAIDLPDYDLCAGCYANYSGDLKFEPVQLERDAPFQERWHRRRAKWAGGPLACRRGPHPHWRNLGGARRGRPRMGYSGVAPPAPPVDQVDVALKEAIRRSLQDVKDMEAKMKQEKAEAATPTPEQVKEEVVPPAEKEPPQPEVVPEVKLEDTKPAAVPTAPVAVVAAAGVSTTRFQVHDDSDDEEENVDAATAKVVVLADRSFQEKPVAVEDKVPETHKETVVVETATDEPSFQTPRSSVIKSSESSHSSSIMTKSSTAESKQSLVSVDRLVDGAIDISFSTDAEGNGEVAAALGEMMDKIATSIDEMLDRKPSTVCSNSEDEIIVEPEDADPRGEKIVDGEEENNNKDDDDDKDDFSSSNGSWDEVDDNFASDEALARAAMVIGSSLLSSDMAHSTENAAAPLLDHNPSTIVSSAETISSVGSVPTTVHSIATTSVRQVSAAQLNRWAPMLEQLHEIGFLDDGFLVETIERLEAANIGVDSFDEITTEQVVNELMKDC